MATSNNSASSSTVAAPPATSEEAMRPNPVGDYYFDSYSHYSIHMEMLKDAVRTGAYRDAILANRHMFKDKVVMDVGCGTGILSMFAAKAGARKVIAIDCSAIATQATEIVAENGFADVIKVVRGKVEELKDLPDGVERVDIIISEWMGYFLLYESMLQSVLYARDRWGTKADPAVRGSGVKLLPSHASMYMVGITDESYIVDRFDRWNSVEGFDFSLCKRLSYIEPLVDSVDRNQIATDSQTLCHFDLAVVKEEELSFSSDVTLNCQRDDVIHGLSVHFDTPFLASHESIVLDTAPWHTQTHWRQTVLYLINPLKVAKGDRVRVQLKSRPNPGNPRDLDIWIQVDLDGKFQISHFQQEYRMR